MRTSKNGTPGVVLTHKSLTAPYHVLYTHPLESGRETLKEFIWRKVKSPNALPPHLFNDSERQIFADDIIALKAATVKAEARQLALQLEIDTVSKQRFASLITTDDAVASLKCKNNRQFLYLAKKHRIRPEGSVAVQLGGSHFLWAPESIAFLKIFTPPYKLERILLEQKL